MVASCISSCNCKRVREVHFQAVALEIFTSLHVQVGQMYLFFVFVCVFYINHISCSSKNIAHIQLHIFTYHGTIKCMLIQFLKHDNFLKNQVSSDRCSKLWAKQMQRWILGAKPDLDSKLSREIAAKNICSRSEFLPV